MKKGLTENKNLWKHLLSKKTIQELSSKITKTNYVKENIEKKNWQKVQIYGQNGESEVPGMGVI